MSTFLIPIAIIVLLIIINGIFVAAEFAIAAAPHTRVAQIAEGGSGTAKRVLSILRSNDLLNSYISTAQVGITIASLGLGMYGEHIVAEWLYEPLHHLGFIGTAAAHTIASIISVCILTYLHVVIGEMIPKSFALQSAAQAAIRLYPIMAFTEKLFRPLTTVLNWIGDYLLKLAGMPAGGTQGRLSSSEELAYIVGESYESGLLDPAEQLYLENVFDFSERTLGQVMTPRTQVVGLPIEASLEEALDLVCQNRYSRYPIYADDRDHILGVLHTKDLARHISQSNSKSQKPFDLKKLMRPAIFVPETLSLEQMLTQFREERFQIAVAIDEFGGTAGIVTLEDLVEELIGEIQDEFDEEIAPIEEISDQQLRVRGDLLLDELRQLYDLELEHDEADTVGGLVMDQLGHMARSGEKVTYADIEFEVESVERLRVNTVVVTLPAKEDEESSS